MNRRCRIGNDRGVSISISILMLILMILTMLVPALSQETDSIPPLTQPPTDPNPDHARDVFERLDELKTDGYLSNVVEESGENWYRTTKQGFDYIHLEGSPSEIGYNHGLLLGEKIQRGIESYAFLTEMRFGMGWDMCRLQGASYWPYMPQEYRDEVDGIVKGCQETGVRNPDGATIDRNDIMAYNAMWDIWWRSSPPGNPLWWWPFRDMQAREEMPHHCSGFVATGDVTRDGGFVIGQSLWMPYHLPPSHGVFADIVPQSGNRILMELQAGMIWSGTEWYLNSAGLVVGETTLGEGPYRWGNTPAFIRIRQAVQYSSSVDEFTDIMITDSNGAYCGDYMVADTKTNEVAIVELGAYEYEVARTQSGFLGSCNYPWDPEVRNEMGESEGWDHSCYPRYHRLAQIAEKYSGQIDIDIAKRTLGDHYDTVEGAINPCSWTLCGHVENASGYPHGSLDGKTTNLSMASNFEVWARYGHSCGRDFIAAEHAAANPDYAFDNLKDMIARPWTTFGFLEPMNIMVVDENGQPVDNARIAFENCADGYLSEGWTDTSGHYTHSHFSTGTYNITAKSGNLRGTIHVDFNQGSVYEIVVTEQDGSGIMGGNGTVLVAFFGVLVLVLVMLWLRKRSGSDDSGD